MKFIALAFSCLLIFSMPANANEADSFNAMVALANKGDAEAQYHVGMMHNCPSSDNLRPIRHFENGGSGSSGLEFRQPAADAASDGLQ
jgi:hypothetical protein